MVCRLNVYPFSRTLKSIINFFIVHEVQPQICNSKYVRYIPIRKIHCSEQKTIIYLDLKLVRDLCLISQWIKIILINYLLFLNTHLRYRACEWILSKFLPCLFTYHHIVHNDLYVQHFIRGLDDEKYLRTRVDVPNLRNAWLIYHSIWVVTSIRCCIPRMLVKKNCLTYNIGWRIF